MKRMKEPILIAFFMLGCFIAGIAPAEAEPVSVVTIAEGVIPVPTTLPLTEELLGNYTKLEIIPLYNQANLKPGESKDISVTVRNRDTRPATVHPTIRSQPYSGMYSVDSSWITVSPGEAVVPAGGNAKFTVQVSVPSDTMRGSYNSLIAFTDEKYPSPYPQAYPNYVHQMNLGVNVVSPPPIQISNPYIYDQVEAGKEYRYTIEVKNTGTSPVQLNPKSGSDGAMVYGPSGPIESPMTENAITVSGPALIQPGATGTLTVIATIPGTASGYYNGYIDLGVDDLLMREGEGRIMVNLNIWKQPPQPYVRKFTMDTKEPITIELAAVSSMYGSAMSADILRQMPEREPSFDATLTGPDGIVVITPVKKVLTGTVSMSSDPVIAASRDAGTYQETNARYIVSYAADGKPGEWLLSIMPKNSQSFEYTITLGDRDPVVPLMDISSGEGMSRTNTTVAEIS